MSSSNRPSRSAWAQCSHACTDGRTDGRDRWQRALCTRARAIQGVCGIPTLAAGEGGKEPFESPGWGLGSWRVHRPMRRLVAQAARGGAMAWLLKLSVALAQRKAAPRTLFGTDFALCASLESGLPPVALLRCGAVDRRRYRPLPTRALQYCTCTDAPPPVTVVVPCLLLQKPFPEVKPTDRLSNRNRKRPKCRSRTSPR